MLLNDAQKLFEQEFDAAVAESAKMLDGELIPEGTEEDYFNSLDEIHHCGVCITREVLNIVWPAVEKYITYLENLYALPPEPESVAP